MKYLFLIAATAAMTSCGNGGHTIRGEAAFPEGSRIYIYEISGAVYYHLAAIDSAEIVNGRFTLELAELADGLFFIGITPDLGDYVFIDGPRINIRAERNKDGEIRWLVEGSPGDKLYREFLEKKYIVSERQTRDSLDNLFYHARDMGDREEMARIKEESIEYYERGDRKEMEMVREMIDINRDNPFGVYLYYTYVFNRKDFPTPEDIDREREYIAGFGPRGQASVYPARMEETLNRYAACAIGVTAPDIIGVDTLGNTLKLSDLRGDYVIVDFWTSYCHWCREETPYLLKAQDKFRDKNFRILGVSSDRDEKSWLDAIHEDGSYWDHLLLPQGSNIYDTYCIKGIPYLILVGPDGTILAKKLRWNDHITQTEKYMTGN